MPSTPWVFRQGPEEKYIPVITNPIGLIKMTPELMPKLADPLMIN